ncbi:RNA pol II accessory factor, Cdc73 family-domain-containing protein [Zopfochytrium polystomum]|nr:RNA pol II accessory factor, Cdc73 family-domain-containing protein [Zopfochytrium polystomum]
MLPVALLRSAIVAGTQPLLLRADGSATNDLRESSFVSFSATTESSAKFDVTSQSGYKEYNLLTLLHFAENKQLDHSAYLQRSIAYWQGRDVQSVTFTDRRDLLAYLKGEIDTSANLREDPVGSGVSGSREAVNGGPHPVEAAKDDQSRKRAGDDDLEGPVDKKLRQSITEGYLHDKKLLSARSTKTFSLALKYGSEVLRPPKPAAAAQSSASSSMPSSKPSAPIGSSSRPPTSSGGSRSSSSSAPKSSSTRGKRGASSAIVPIIVVPAALQATITLHNIKGFLADLKYEPTEEFIKKGVSKPVSVNIERKNVAPGLPKVYEVIDSIDRLRSSDWDRIIAVFATGQEWQFKNWKFGSVVNIMAKVKGFCLKFSDEPLNEKIKNWNVTVLSIHRQRRHLDAQEVNKFWGIVDTWVRDTKGGVFQ